MIQRPDGYGDTNYGGEKELVVPDIMGSLVGVRGFDLDSKGRLVGRYFPVRVAPGWNEAHCYQGHREGKPSGPDAFEFSLDDDAEDYITLKEGYERAKCPGIARQNHGCGWYVMSTRRWDDSYGILQSVVEVAGQVEIGPLGMRGQRMRVVALTRPYSTPLNTDKYGAVAWRQSKKDYLRSTLEELHADRPKGLDWLRPAELMRYLDDIVTMSVWRRAYWMELEDVLDDLREYQENIDRFENITRMIYKVPVYDTFMEMMEAHPITDLHSLYGDDSA